LKYYPDTDPSAPGLLKEITDCRQRKVTYEYDAFRRLHIGRLRKRRIRPLRRTTSAAATVRSASTTTTAPSPRCRPTMTCRFSRINDFLELAANVESITDPAENAGANGGSARVKFVYNYGTDPDQRDRATDQKWPCASVSGEACTERAASLTYGANSATAHVKDVLGQPRDYTLSHLFPDKHYHVRTMTEPEVPVIEEAAALPAPTPTVSMAPHNHQREVRLRRVRRHDLARSERLPRDQRLRHRQQRSPREGVEVERGRVGDEGPQPVRLRRRGGLQRRAVRGRPRQRR
jgi:hypothetical protein